MTTDTNVDEYESGVLRIFQTREETRAYYNKIAKVYDLLAERSEQPMRKKGLARLNARPGERMLEVGFATGHTLVALAEAVGSEGRVYGIDLSDEMLRYAAEAVQRAGVADRVELTCGDAARLPYPGDSFDGIFTSFTLELFDTPEMPAVLTEWMRVLKPGGRIAVVSLSKEGRQNLVMRAFEWTHRHFPNLMDCRAIYVRRAIEAAGYRIVSTDLEHMWVPVEIVLATKPEPPRNKKDTP